MAFSIRRFIMDEKLKNELPEIVNEYLEYNEGTLNKSVLSVNEYGHDLKTFLKYIYLRKNLVPADADYENINIKSADAKIFSELTLKDANAFLSYCASERNNSPKTRARKVSSIRMFYKWLHLKMHYIDENPMELIESPKTEKKLPKYLTLEQSQSLLYSIDGKNKERDYAIITLFLNCGMRLSELVSINNNNIKITNNSATIVITGKGSKQRTVYLNQACVDAIEKYMKVRPKDGVTDKNALFLSNRRKRISKQMVQHLVYEFLEKSGNEGYSVHKLRHTAATLMYQYGDVDVLALKEILGHENLATTEIYTHVMNEQLKNAVDRNPLAHFGEKKDDSDEDE